MSVCATIVCGVFAAVVAVQAPTVNVRDIMIVDSGYVEFRMTSHEAGPVIGNMLNAHFFPGINEYAAGYYTAARANFTYVVESARYLDENSRKGEFMSTSHYLRGMIYAYHAEGVGRYSLAKQDFEAAIEWNHANYPAYLELARVYVTLGLTEPALTILTQLVELAPEDGARAEASVEIERIRTEGGEQEGLPSEEGVSVGEAVP